MRVLGIDPGTAITGWGIVETSQTKISAVSAEDRSVNSTVFGSRVPGPGYKVRPLVYGVIRTDSKEVFSKRLEIIYRELKKIIRKYKPDVVSIEEIFFAKNVKTALMVGHARGVVILAAINAGLEIVEYTPLQVKQALVGYGRAEKQQVQKMVKILLSLEDIPKPDDVADALAVAICHFNSRKLEQIYKSGSIRNAKY